MKIITRGNIDISQVEKLLCIINEVSTKKEKSNYNKIIKGIEDLLKEFKADLKKFPNTKEASWLRKFYTDKIKSNNAIIFKNKCSKCLGTGKLDWIENVVGKKPMYNDGTSMTNISFT